MWFWPRSRTAWFRSTKRQDRCSRSSPNTPTCRSSRWSATAPMSRSEERRVGKERTPRWTQNQQEKKSQERERRNVPTESNRTNSQKHDRNTQNSAYASFKHI